MRLQDKVCLVTGASGGIGAATVARFQAEGAKVVGVDLSEDAPGDLSLQVDVTHEARSPTCSTGPSRRSGAWTWCSTTRASPPTTTAR